MDKREVVTSKNWNCVNKLFLRLLSVLLWV